MLGKTHRAGGVTFMMVGFEAMRTHGMLIPELSPLVQLLIMYPASQWGSTLPDLDHHWQSVGAKTPFNRLVHFLLHLTKPKHRSWQTHSLLFTGGVLSLIYTLVLVGDQFFGVGSLKSMDWIVIRLIVVGTIVGVASHMFLDFINPSGIHLYPGYKIRLVPKTSYFATGGPWEDLVFKICNIISVLAVLNLVLSFWDLSILGLIQDAYHGISSSITSKE